MNETKKRFLGIGVLAAIAVITFAFAIAASGSGVIEQNAEGVAVAASEVTTSSINYQGRLTDSAGEPLSGSYTMTFRLCEVASGGTALATDSHSVEVTGGLFSTDMSFAQNYFDGRELWLGIAVGGEEISPRQEFKPVPYALSLVPGAVINGSVSGAALVVNNTLSDGYGILIGCTGDYSRGIEVRTEDYESEGVVSSTYGNDSECFLALSYGKDSEGFFTRTYGKGSEGLRAYTYGEGSNGVCLKTTGDKSEGAYAKTTGKESEGFFASTTGYNSWGVYARTTGNSGNGVGASTTGEYSEGVWVKTTGNNSDGVWVKTTGNNSEGVYAYSNKSDAIYADTGRPDHKYGVHTPDYMYAAKYEGGGSDVAEYFPVAEDTEPGTVMVIGENSKLQCSATPYDTTVAGIVSTAPGIALGTNETGNEGETLIAVAGRVPCKVDASYASVKPGDLLTTSDTPGHAMKAQPVVIGELEIYRSGTTLGKALEPLDSGTGVIEVLVTLQ